MSGLIENLLHFSELSNSTPKMKKLEDFSYQFNDDPSYKTLVLSALTHGNEVGGLDVLIDILKSLQNKSLDPKLNLRFILGNVDAYKANKRFLETDMNRSFMVDTPQSLEEKRAAMITPFIKGVDYLIDFHQTIRPTVQPFFVLDHWEESFDFARSLDHTFPLITGKNFSSLSNGKAVTTTSQSSGAKAVTIELGQMGSSLFQAKIGSAIARQAIILLEQNAIAKFHSKPWQNCYTWGQTVENPDFSLELVGQFKNFDPIKKGDLLATNGNSKIHAEIDGMALFPKYGESQKTSKELIRILKPVASESDL